MIEAHHPIRVWFARHLAAIFVGATVLGFFWLKNQCRTVGPEQGNIFKISQFGEYGWPMVWRLRFDVTDDPSVVFEPMDSVIRWRRLAIDIAAVLFTMAATFILFSRTQRRVHRWWQISLATIVAFAALVGVLGAIWNAKSIGFW